MRELEIDPEGYWVMCPQTRRRRTGHACFITGGFQCEYCEGVDVKPSKRDVNLPAVVVRCKYGEV